MHNENHPAVRILVALLGLTVLSLYQLVGLEKLDGTQRVAFMIFAAHLPILTALYMVHTDPNISARLEKAPRRKRRMNRITAILMLPSLIGTAFLFSHFGWGFGAAFVVSIAVSIALANHFEQVPEEQPEP